LTSTGALSRDFYVRHDDGVAKLVQFHEDDDLILLLGDGLTQLIDDDEDGNGGGGDDENKENAKQKPMTLHVPWHSLSIATQDSDYDDEARVWYGRMVLPPANALHRATGLSYGDLRQQLNDADDQAAATAATIGCSSSSLTTVIHPRRRRHLQDDKTPDATRCANNNTDQLLCWHQCMAVAEFGVNETFCNGQNLDLACVDRNNVLWNGDHADESAGFQPRCFDLSTSNSSSLPPPVATDNSTTTTTTTAVATNATTGEYDGDGKSAAVSVATLSKLASVVVAISCAVIGTV
jgi:hypothetical protein